VSTSASILQEETSIDEFFNVMATETLALFEHLEFDFLEEFDVFAPLAGGEHEIITHQHSSERSCTATTRTSTASVQSRENSRTRSSGSAVASIDRRRETRSIASSPTSNTSSTRSSTAVEQAACRGLLDLTYPSIPPT